VDSRAQDALETLVRRVVCSNLDEMAGEIERLRREVVALERIVGLLGQTPGRRQRQARVAELRGRGYSTRAIAQLLHTDRESRLAGKEAVAAFGPMGKCGPRLAGGR
jgi:hypothetical protein